MIPITLLDCTLEADYPLDLGANPGSTIRGALYEALATMYDTGDPVSHRHDTETNPVAWLLRLEDEETSGGKDVPRSIALRPPEKVVAPRHTFTLAFYGRGQEAIPMVLSAVGAMGSLGIGRNRNRQQARLTTVSVRDPLSGQVTPLIDTHGHPVGNIPPPLSTNAYSRFASLLVQDALTVRFITPTRIIANGNLCRTPNFRHWVQRLLERVRLISELYAEPVWIHFRELLAQADHVTLLEDGTHWQEYWSHSRIDGMYKPVSGFVGVARYQGDISALLPYIVLGQALQLGKNTIKGCGWYEISYHWQ